MAGSSVLADGDYRRRSRRSWSFSEKLAILEDLATSGDPLAEVARRHGINANQLLTWRSRARAGTLERRRGRPPRRKADVGFVRVDVAPAPSGLGSASPDGMIEVELAGGAKVRFVSDLDPGRLCGVLRAVSAAL